MEGYFNFGFTNSVRKSSAWFLGQRATESNYKIDVEWSCDSVERNSMEDVDTIDTDLDSDSFLSDLERDSGEQRGEAGGERSQRYSHRDWEEAVHSGSGSGLRTTNNHSQERQESQEGQERQEVRRAETLGGSLSQVRAGKPSVETGGESWCCYFTLLDISCITGLLSLSALIFSLIAPDWVTNTEPSQSALVRLNPWDICLTRLQANSSSPAGCWTTWNLEVSVVPAWFLVVPATLLLVSSLSLSARALLFLIWFKKRQIFPLKLGVKLMVTCVVMDYLSGLGLLVSTMMFAASVLSSPSLATSTSAINLSWGWAASLTSSWGHVATATLLARSTHRERKKRAQNENFIRNIPA